VISSFPKGIDPCGENGEFHTFCYDGPVFKSNVPFKKGDIIKKEYEISPDKKIPYYFFDIS
jgi:diphthamide synthase (EF-2-diphthine--ammonia ligase)